MTLRANPPDSVLIRLTGVREHVGSGACPQDGGGARERALAHDLRGRGPGEMSADERGQTEDVGQGRMEGGRLLVSWGC